MIRSIKSDIASLIDIINSDLETIHRIGRLSATLRMERKWKGPLWWDEIMDQTCLKHFEYHKQKYIDVIKTIRENHKDLLVHLAI